MSYSEAASEQDFEADQARRAEAVLASARQTVAKRLCREEIIKHILIRRYQNSTPQYESGPLLTVSKRNL